ncbi:MAG: nucleotidyltransferase family protein, partial [Succiniclasticum sp.]|nr:nucleotidyltransferase family protein [Succiniclasticum sp.]
MSLHAIGITAEYNPFHNGHRWQLQTLREKSGNVPVIACMSGWFVQRGEMAAADPWIRASMAVHAGVDLVVLLPAWFSLRSADYFAAGAVKTLAATGIVDTLVCGSEHTCTASSSLSSTATWSLLPETEQQIKILLQQGLSYGAAWETAASRSQKDAGWFKGANNLLALAYQKALLHNHLAIELITLPRQGSGYNDTELRPPYASASAIRTALRNGVSAAELAPFL